MNTVRTYSRSLATSWIAQGADLMVAFFLAPFMIHSLGDDRYGIWSLVLSTAGWLGLADVGLRRSVSKHLNEYLGQDDEQRARELVSTTAALFLVTGSLTAILSVVLGGVFDRLFPSLPQDHFVEAWIALSIAGFTFALGLQSSLLRRILESFNRFDQGNWVMILSTGVRAAGVVLVLTWRGGLVGLALVALACTLLSIALMYTQARRTWPGMAFRKALIRKVEAVRVVGTGLYIFFDNIAGRLVHYANLLIIGALLDIKAVTVYSIGLMLITYAQGFLEHVARVMTPDIFKHAGAGDLPALRHLFVRTSNVTAFLSIPVYVGFLFFGTEFIGLWMTREPGASALVLQILTWSTLAVLSSQAVGSILVGVGRARLAAVLSMIEGVANVALSVLFVLALRWDLPGVAVGTLIPMVIVTGIVKPLIVCRIIRMGFGTFLARTLLRWVPAGACFAAVCLALSVVVPEGSWTVFIPKVAILGVLYLPIGWYALLEKEARDALRLKLLHSARGQ
jgi:O-antigen/teichoic acid export membrane protein